MEFTKSLVKGKLVKRYKRFFADIKVNKEILTAHCPNTGSMMGLLDKNNDAWISKNDDPKRKLKYTLEIIKVKNVTLNRKKNISEFPDAVTSRGSKHLKKLTESIKHGYKPFVLFLIQIQNISEFRIAKDIDSDYYNNFIKAKKKGLKFIAYRCKLNSKEIVIEKKIKIEHD